MGIQGLLQGLKHCSTQGHIKDYSGQAIAVDASSWLHKSVYSIADHYVETIESGSVDARCIDASAKYVTKRCQELLTYANIQRIYLVMDGKRCPLKAVTNQDRERRRQENLAQARQYRRQNDREKMYEKYKACIKIKDDLTKAVAQRVAQRFRDSGRVQLVWAPYEADAMLVKLCVDGIAQAVVTEDSDVLVYSAACHASFPILFKLDRNTGACDVVTMDWLLSPDKSTTKTEDSKASSGLEPILNSFVARQARDPGKGARLFVQSCVLAGCDYAPNELNGVGLVNAFKNIRNAIHMKPEKRFRHVLKMLPRKARGQLDMVEYEELLSKSEAVFYYHPVCETDGRVVYLQDPSSEKGAQYLNHRPCLDRFGSDWSLFLGDVASSDGAGSAPLQRPSNVVHHAPPVSEITVNKAGKRSNRPKTHRSLASTAAEASGYDAGDKEIADIIAMANPYQKSKKRKRDDGRKPFQPKSPNEKPSPQSNMFAKFTASGKENPTVNNLNRYLAQEDVRFVKRTFPKDGSRTLQKIPLQAKSVASTLSQKCFDYGQVIDLTETDPVSSEPASAPEPSVALREETSSLKQTPSDEVIDDTDLFQRRATDQTSAPFNNPALEDEDSNKRSKYFSDKPDYVRRVTLDSPERSADELDEAPPPQNNAEPPAASFLSQQAATLVAINRQPVSFDVYDDWLSPEKASTDGWQPEEIVESPFAKVVQAPPVAEPRKPKSSIGPAKTLRFRFGGSAKVNPLLRGFHRQKDSAGAEGTHSTSRSIARVERHGLFKAQKQKRPRRPKAKTTNTLLSHFSVVTRKRGTGS